MASINYINSIKINDSFQELQNNSKYICLLNPKQNLQLICKKLHLLKTYSIKLINHSNAKINNFLHKSQSFFLLTRNIINVVIIAEVVCCFQPLELVDYLLVADWLKSDLLVYMLEYLLYETMGKVLQHWNSGNYNLGYETVHAFVYGKLRYCTFHALFNNNILAGGMMLLFHSYHQFQERSIDGCRFLIELFRGKFIQ